MVGEAGFVVLIVIAAAVYLAAFITASSRPDRAVALAVGSLGAGAALLLVLVATFMYSLRCDENCNENLIPSARTPGWRNTSHAWQWDAQWALALVVLAAAIAATVLVGLRWRRVALAAAAIAAACAFAWVVLLAS